jgi:hypothetical protein
MKYQRTIPFALILGAALSCNVTAGDAPKLVVKTGIWEWDRVMTVNGKTSTLHNCLGLRAAEFVNFKADLSNEKQCESEVLENTAKVYAYKATCRPSGNPADLVGSGTVSGRIVAESETRVRVTLDSNRTILGMKTVEHAEEVNEWRGSSSQKECKQSQMSLH